MDQEDSKIESENAGKPSTEMKSPEKKTKKVLKAKRKIVKSVAKNFLKTKKASSSPLINATEGKEKDGKVLECSEKKNDEGSKNVIPVKENIQKSCNSDGHIDSGAVIQNKQGNVGPSVNEHEFIGPSGNKENIDVQDCSREHKKQDEKLGTSGINQNRKEKLGHRRKRLRSKTKQKLPPPKDERKLKEKLTAKQEKQKDDKPEKRGGLIFMCSGKTRPDCFRYRVMGALNSKKDFILSVKPGLKLFLYDFDLKLMYGVYKASSSGGMKLEPRAFGGGFPAQVRFKIDADCYPLPESVFKKAIKENYDAKQKFKTELTTRQVRKLVRLFRPVTLHSKALPAPSPPRARVSTEEESEHVGLYHERKEGRPHSDRKRRTWDSYSDGRARGYAALSRERDYQLAYEERGSRRNGENPPDLYLNAKDYRTYGLRGERRNMTCQSNVGPTLSPYGRDYDRDQLIGQQDPLYEPSEREVICSDLRYIVQKDYHAYDLGVRRALLGMHHVASINATAVTAAIDPYAVNRGYAYDYVASASSSDPYYPAPRAEMHVVDNHLRRESNEVDRLYSTYGTEALSQYSRAHHVESLVRAAAAPVTSRYSFGEPSLSYR